VAERGPYFATRLVAAVTALAVALAVVFAMGAFWHLKTTPIDVMKMATPIKALEEQTRRNMEMFQNAIRMFTPFPNGTTGTPPAAAPEPAPKPAPGKAEDLQELKEQIAAMQRKIDQLS